MTSDTSELLEGYPAEFDLDVVLRSGEIIRLRPIRPEDRDLEADFFTRVSPESAYNRFFQVKSQLTEAELDYFTQVDYRDRMAFVAIYDEKMVAVGRYDTAPPEEAEGEGKLAEVAFLVEDEFQGRGVGTLLLQHLTVYARLQGIERFRAYTLVDNIGMQRVLIDSGYEITRKLQDEVYELELDTTLTDEARQAEGAHEKWAIATSLQALFTPNAVAVIGASRNNDSIGGRLFANLMSTGFPGPVYPVNPNANVVRSVRAYPSIADVPDQVDLAFIVTPAPHVAANLAECAEHGVKAVVVISAGFGETGETGRVLEQELVEIARRAGMRMVGPNCMGLVTTDPEVRLNGQFGPVFPVAGNVAMSSQSGALGLAILEQAADMGIGVSKFVSVGNKADVSGNDLMLYWEDDPATDVILLYLESFGNPRRFARLARRIGKEKPIVAVKSGRSDAGARAAASHTGSMANVEVAVEALFRRSGVIRAETLSQMFDVTALLAHQPVPRGRRVAVLTNAGGPGILSADAIEAYDLELPELSAKLQHKLHEVLPSEASVTNPVDMVASAGPEQYEFCLDALLGSDEVDAVIAIYAPTTLGGAEAVATAVKAAAVRKPEDIALLAVFMQAQQGIPSTLRHEPDPIPVYPYPEPAARALASAVEYGEWRAKPEGSYPVPEGIDHAKLRAVVDEVCGSLDEGRDAWLSPDDTSRLLESLGINVAETRIATSPEEAAEIARAMGGPVVLKVIADSVLHKSDVDGVALDVRGAQTVRQAYRAVTSVADDASGVIIQPFVEGGHEVIIGMTEDPLFGPLVVFGLGGVYVELMRDVAFRIHPVSAEDAAEMISEVRSARLLDGFRGAPLGDKSAVADTILRVSALIEQAPEIIEMDMNPVLVGTPGQGVEVVDARVRVRKPVSMWMPSRKDIPGVMSVPGN
jgi:acetyl coenzyme A synthetase (ADP forming)-like protein